jgi:CRP-like cAMP-binding protein
MTTIERVLVLQGVDIFKDVTTQQLSYVAMIAEEIKSPAGKVLYRENDLPDGLYVVVAGSVVATRGTEVLERISANGSFGAWALFNDEPRLTNAIASEASTLLFIPREQFYEVLSSHSDIVPAMFKYLVGRIHQLAAIAEN